MGVSKRICCEKKAVDFFLYWICTKKKCYSQPLKLTEKKKRTSFRVNKYNMSLYAGICRRYFHKTPFKIHFRSFRQLCEPFVVVVFFSVCWGEAKTSSHAFHIILVYMFDSHSSIVVVTRGMKAFTNHWRKTVSCFIWYVRSSKIGPRAFRICYWSFFSERAFRLFLDHMWMFSPTRNDHDTAITVAKATCLYWICECHRTSEWKALSVGSSYTKLRYMERLFFFEYIFSYDAIAILYEMPSIACCTNKHHIRRTE